MITDINIRPPHHRVHTQVHKHTPHMYIHIHTFMYATHTLKTGKNNKRVREGEDAYQRKLAVIETSPIMSKTGKQSSCLSKVTSLSM